jgi:RND family efflux transporter MFP subunit
MSTVITNHSKWLIVSILLLVITISGLVLYDAEDKVEKKIGNTLLPVTVVTLTPQSKNLIVSATGITQARWITKLVAVVEGRADSLAENLEPGMLVDSDQVLLRQKSGAYQAAVDGAISQLAMAKLALEKTIHQQTVAKASKAKLLTPYARFEPQVQSAKDSVNAAKSSLKNARQQLADTQIKSPFPAIILERQVTPGQWLQAGQQLFLLADQDSIDVKVEIPDSDWNQLASTAINAAALVTTNENEQWSASIRSITPTRDRSTRQRSLILKISSPYVALPERKVLLPDTQVKIEFSGKKESQIFVIPSSALTEDGDIWTLDEQDQLQLEHVQLFSQTVEEVVVRFKENSLQTRRIVLYPLGSMIQGQQVKVIEGQQ